MATPQTLRGNNRGFGVVLKAAEFEIIESIAAEKGMKWRILAQNILKEFAAKNGKSAQA
jgi:hypothetical protein